MLQCLYCGNHEIIISRDGVLDICKIDNEEIINICKNCNDFYFAPKIKRKGE